MKQQNKIFIYYISLLLWSIILNYNFVLALFPTSFNSVDSTNGFRISQTFDSISYGDMNGDGHDDFIGVLQYVGVYVFYGPLASNFEYPTDSSKINGVNGFIFSNNKVTSNQIVAGDINNDGFDDIAFFLNISPGQLGVIYGTNQVVTPHLFSTLNGINGFYIKHVYATNVAFGYVRSIIDFNGDSIKDLFVSTSAGSMASGSPIAYMLFGINGGKFPVNSEFAFDPSTFNGNNGFVINGLQAYNSFPYDINNDGIDDIIINRQQVAINVIYGRRGPFTSPYEPVYNGVNGTIFNFSGFSFNSNFANYGFGDFNQDGLNDFVIPLRLDTNNYMTLILYGKTQYPALTTLSESISVDDGLIVKDRRTDPIFSTWGATPRLSDVNNDGFADLLINGGSGVPFTIIFGNNIHYTTNTIYLEDITQSMICTAQTFSNTTNFIESGDFNSDGINDIGVVGVVILYGETYIGSISVINSIFPFNSLTNLIYNIFNNNIDSVNGECGITMVTLTIENAITGDQFIIDNSYDNTIYSITSKNNNTKLIIELKARDETKVIANDVLGKISVSLALRVSNRTVSMKYGSELQSITIIGAPNANCQSKCLNGGTCDDVFGCQCINDYYGDYCDTKDCTIQCLNGGSCNTSIGECSCINDFYGNNCGTKDCTVTCLNSAVCNTTVGQCVCTQGYEGIDCSGISCQTSCLNGGSCNTTIGECACINNFYGNDCGSKDCAVTCLNGAICDTSIGECLCSKGYEGIDCGGISCSVSCLNGGSCNTTIGECACINDFYGNDCGSKDCAVTCQNGGSCNTTISECQCIDDHEGEDCSNKKKKTNVGVIIGPIIGGLVLIAIIIVAVILIRKKKSKQKDRTVELKTQASTVGVFVGGQITNIDKF